jgi:1,2-diacylglycerol 3-alpha-glucosyltransferase
MRVVITGQTYYPGNNGQAIFTIHLAEGLARAGHDVAVIVPSWQLKSETERINGVLVYKIRSFNFPWIHPEACYAFLPRTIIRQFFRSFKPDVVHLQDHYFISRDVAAVARQERVPLMGTNHFLPENLLPYLDWMPFSRGFIRTVMWKLMLWSYNRLDVVTTPTETAASILSEQDIHPPVFPISCGVDTGHFTPAGASTDLAAERQSFGLDPERVLFLYVGRLDIEKRIDLLLHGLAGLLKAGHCEVQMAIAGQGAGKGELQALAHSLGLEGHVHFLGYVPSERLVDLYRCADLFAMPSPEELQSIATLEAMACGRPVLAARARALPELVTSGQNGWLFEPGQAESVTRGMAYLIERRPEWQRMGMASRSRAQAHSLEKTIHSYEEIYSQVSGVPARKENSAMPRMRVRLQVD